MRFKNKDLTKLYCKYLHKKSLLVWKRGSKSILVYLQGDSNKEFPLSFLTKTMSNGNEQTNTSEYLWDVR